MKKVYLYASLFVTAMAFTACDEDFKDWAAPQAWEQEAAQEALTEWTAACIERYDLHLELDDGVRRE